jgi:hypothetical protein
MASIIRSFHGQICSLFGLSLLLLVPGLAQAEPNFLGNVPAGTSYYPAIAKIGVRVPSQLDSTGKEFDFTTATTDYIFEVTGQIQITRSGPLNSFNDLITGASVTPSGGGLNTLQLEMVNLTSVNITNPAGATINNIKLGDGVPDGINSGAFFSTGGAAEIGLDGSLANAFLNLFLETNVVQPVIPIPGPLQALLGLGTTTPIGALHNNTELHLEAQISEFAPDGVSFLLTNGPVGAFAPTSNAFVQALAGLPAPFNRPLAEMQFAQFVSADLQIVPEPGSVIFGLMAAGAFGTFVWRHRRAAMTA